MKIVIFLVTLYIVVCVRSLPPVDVYAFCDDKPDGYHCASCLQPVYCNSSAIPSATELQTCSSYEVCETFSSTLATCVDHDSSVTYCECEPESNFCDPYNNNYIATCDQSGYVTNVTQCGDGKEDVCVIDACVRGATCEGVADGSWVQIYPECSMGYQCVSDEIIFERTCPIGYYLADNGGCLRAPPSPCNSNCTGNCPDETDCTRYYFCDGLGGVLSGPKDCPENSYFNPKGSPPVCVENDPSVCSSLTYCVF